MTRVQLLCPNCDVTVTMDVADILLVLETSEHGTYKFTCPGCGTPGHKPANRQVIKILRDAGVLTEGPVIPDEAAPAGSPPLTYDDVLDFGLLMEQDDSDLQIEAWLGKEA